MVFYLTNYQTASRIHQDRVLIVVGRNVELDICPAPLALRPPVAEEAIETFQVFRFGTGA